MTLELPRVDNFDDLPEDDQPAYVSTSSWQPVALGPIVAGVQAGEIVGPVPSVMSRTDGVCMLYRSEIHQFAGEPESGKGWANLTPAAELINRGEDVLVIDFEDAAPSIVTRLLALGARPEAIVERFTYVRPVDPLDATQFYELISRPYALAIIDGVSEAFAQLGLDLASNLDAAKFLATLPRPIAERGAAVVLIDHVAKAKETRGRYALGAQHKLAGVAAAYSTEVITPASRTTEGLVKIKVEKDRHGHVRGHAQAGVIALMRITPADDGGQVEVTFEPPESTTGEDGEFRPTRLMEKVSRFLEEQPGSSVRAIRDGVQGRGAWIDVALRRLIVEGNVDRRVDGRSQQHYVITAFREDEDTYVSRVPDVSDRVPDTVSRTVSHVSPPYGGTRHRTHHEDTPRGHDCVPTSSEAFSTPSTASMPDADAELARLAAKGLVEASEQP